MKLPTEGFRQRMDSREAADAGLLLWRKNFVYFILFFAIPFWVCAFFSRLLPGKTAYFSYLILWWLKPLFDRLILHIISIRFFESVTSMKKLCRGLGKNLIRGLPGDLLWRRFSPLRSAMMPVRMLELAGKTEKKSRLIKKRKINLRKGGINYCFLLTLWGIAIEITLLAGEIIFVAAIITHLAPNLYNLLFENITAGVEIYIFAAWCFNYMLVETIYVCMGFSLYINSRIEVEGWDLELKFRSFAKKHEKKNLLKALIAVFCFACIFFPAELSAEELPQLSAKKNMPLEELQNILESPDFGGEKDSWGIRRKNKPEETVESNLDLSPFFKTLQLIIAGTLRIFLIILLAALAVILFLFARKMINRRIPKRKNMMTALHGIHPENPNELLNKSLDFYKQGELRLAWGYCTAAIILSWQFYRGIIFPPNATESDCVSMVNETQSSSKELSADEVKIFVEQIKNWINFAYAGKLPPPESFDEAVFFCKSLGTSNG